MSSAAEARFRVQAPNSRPRAITIVALDPYAEPVVSRLATSNWSNATFLTSWSNHPNAHLAGGVDRLRSVIGSADLVVMVAGPGGQAYAAESVGKACSSRRVMTTALIVGAQSASDEALAKTLAQVRPWSLMTVIADDDAYIDDMLVALRA